MQLLKKLDSTLSISLTGYVDDLGTEKMNQRLTDERVSNIKDYLKKSGVTSELLQKDNQEICNL